MSNRYGQYEDFVSKSQGNISAELTNHAIYGMDDVFMDWLSPQQKEQRQMGESLIMEQLTPQAKMAGLKAAGVNPLTAASGIAGSGSSYQAPASSTNPIGDVAGAAGSLATGFGSVAGGVSDLTKLAPEVANIEADTASKFAGIGLTNAQTQGVLTDNTYKDEDWKTRLNVQRQQFENMKAEYKNLEATHEEIMKHIDEMISQIEVNGSIEDYNNAMKLKVDEETRWIKSKNDFCIGHNLFLNESGIAGYIFSMVESGASMEQFDDFIEIYSAFRGSEQYAISRGQFDADIDTSFDRAFNQALGDTEVQAQFANYFGDVEVLKEALKEMYKELIENPGNPLNFVGKVLNLLFQGAAAIDTPKAVSKGPQKAPVVQPKQSHR